MNEKMEVASQDIHQRLASLTAAAAGERGRAQTEALQVYFAALRKLNEGGEFSAAEAIAFADACRTAGKDDGQQQADARVIANGLTARKFLDAHGDLDEQLKITRDEIAAFESELSSFTEKLRLRAKPSFARLGELENLENRRLSARREVENLDKLLHPPTPKPFVAPSEVQRQIQEVLHNAKSDAARLLANIERLQCADFAGMRDAAAALFLLDDGGFDLGTDHHVWPKNFDRFVEGHARALLAAAPGAMARHRKRFGDVSNARLSYVHWTIIHGAADAGWFHLEKDIEAIPHEFAPTTGWQGVALRLSVGAVDVV